jgi:hypothetical protein
MLLARLVETRFRANQSNPGVPISGVMAARAHQEGARHHALADARWTKEALAFLAGLNPAAGERRCVGRKNPDQLTAASA